MGFLIRNWHLKLSAVLLATILYTGLVFSGSFSESTIEVRIEGVNPPNSSIVLSGELGFVTVRYRIRHAPGGDGAFGSHNALSDSRFRYDEGASDLVVGIRVVVDHPGGQSDRESSRA